jgi:hypothetical protein
MEDTVPRTALTGILTLTTAALVVAGCGSAAAPGSSPTTAPRTRPALVLARGGETASGATAKRDAVAIAPERPVRYVLDAPLPDLGPTGVVRRMSAHRVEEADVRRFADALGLAAPPLQVAGGWEVRAPTSILSVQVSPGGALLTYSAGEPGASGGSSGSSGAATGTGTAPNPATKSVPPVPVPVPGSGPVQAPDATVAPSPSTTPTTASAPSPPVDVPSATDAAATARALLDRMGVLDAQQWTTTVTDSGGVAVSCPAGVPCPSPAPEVFARTVTFSLLLDGSPVAGVEWFVTIGEHHVIQSLDGNWAAPTSVGTYPLRTPAAVFADLQQGHAHYVGPQPLADGVAGSGTADPMLGTTTGAPDSGNPAVHVTGCSLGLARWDGYENNATVTDLVPTYRFHVSATPGSSYDIEVLALEPGAVSFTTPPVPKPQPLPIETAPGLTVPGGATPGG